MLFGKGSTFQQTSKVNPSPAEFRLLMINSLPNDEILDWSKLKAFADDKLNVTKELKFVLGREENIVGKGENAASQCFQKAPFTEVFKVWILW